MEAKTVLKNYPEKKHLMQFLTPKHNTNYCGCHIISYSYALYEVKSQFKIITSKPAGKVKKLGQVESTPSGANLDLNQHRGDLEFFSSF